MEFQNSPLTMEAGMNACGEAEKLCVCKMTKATLLKRGWQDGRVWNGNECSQQETRTTALGVARKEEATGGCRLPCLKETMTTSS